MTGALGSLLAVRGRRRIAIGLARALPELAAGERRRLVRAAGRWAARRRPRERRALRLVPEEFCRRLSHEGWENLHNASADGREPLFLLAPLGSRRVARRVLELYHQGRVSAAVLPATADDEGVAAALFSRGVRCNARPARRALAGGLTAVWALALPERRGRWRVCFPPPIPPAGDDTAASLTERYLSVLEGMIRRHPACWPWGDFG